MKQPIPHYDEAVWRPLLAQALIRHDGNKQAVAVELGCSRTTVSLVVANKYPSPIHAFAHKVMTVYDRYDCPFLGESVTRAACHGHANREAPTSSPREMRHWRACQGCDRNPSKRSES